VALELAGFGHPATPVTVGPFAIARTPVTNAQFAPFVAAGGYATPAWWTAEGWVARLKESWTEPRYWLDRDWGRADCPVVGVSWHEALAYARWLSDVSGETITLPNEAQWQRAAQGDDGRDYPWGDQLPDDSLCNWNRDVDETTPVEAYPAGASPYGVLDMSGNVWEWCLSAWREEDDHAAGGNDYGARVLRGGAWSSDSSLSLRAANRNATDPNTRQPPHTRDTRYGFRVVKG
jgi:formylglycine-generating enzyme required for sulfatase activity